MWHFSFGRFSDFLSGKSSDILLVIWLLTDILPGILSDIVPKGHCKTSPWKAKQTLQ
jgi:hypothetical protein